MENRISIKDCNKSIPEFIKKELSDYQLNGLLSLITDVEKNKQGKLISWEPGVWKSLPIILYSIQRMHKVKAPILLISPKSIIPGIFPVLTWRCNWYKKCIKLESPMHYIT